jgi:hypothetical protein
MDGNIIIDLIIIAVIISRRELKLILLKFISTGFQPIYRNVKRKYIIGKILPSIGNFI